MKFIYTLVLLSMSVVVAAQTPYCKPRVFEENVCQSDSWVSGVTVANISNPNNRCDEEDPFFPAQADGYSDYTDMVARIDPKTGTVITVSLSGLFTDVVEVWVDWNANGEFEETEYQLLAGESTASNFTGVLIPPVGAVTDSVITGGLRVVGSFLFPQLDPCADVQFGEIEDYSFIVTSEPAPPNDQPNDYCDAVVTSVSTDQTCGNSWITGFTCNNVNITDGLCDREAEPTFSEPFDGYSDYSDQFIEFDVGAPTTATLTVDGNLLDLVNGWIDWNNDGVWSESELVPFVGEGGATLQFTAAITPPQNAVVGVPIKGGVRIKGGFLTPPTDPCADEQFYEIEDYSFIVLDPDLVACPSNLMPADSTEDLCNDVTFSWGAVEGAEAYNLQLFKGEDTVFTQETSDTSVTVENLLPDTEFKWLVRSVESSGRKSYACDTLTFTTNPELSPSVNFMPANDTLCAGTSNTLMPNVAGSGTLTYSWNGDVATIDDIAITQPVFSANAGDYTLSLTVSDEFNCSSQDTLSINVPASATVENIAANTSVVCFGEDLIVNLESNADSLFFLATEPNSPFQPVEPTNAAPPQYFFNGTDSVVYAAQLYLNGCPDTVLIDTIFYQPQLEPLAVDFELDLDSLPCMGDSVLLRATNYTDGLEWQDGSTNDTIFLTESTDILLTYTENGCSIALDTAFNFDALPTEVTLDTEQDLGQLCNGDSVVVSHQQPEGFFRWFDGDTEAVSRSFFTNDSVYLDYITPNGCVTPSDTLAVTFKPLPDAPTFTTSITGDSICEGESVILTNTDTLPKTWSTGSTADSIAVSASGDYAIEVFLEGCSAASDTFSLTVNPRPSQPEIEVFPNGAGDSLWSALPAEAYQWFINDTLSTFTTRAIPSEENSYILVVVNAFGCESEASEAFTVTGIREWSTTDVDLRYNPTTKAWEWSADQPFDIKVWTVDAKLLMDAQEVTQASFNGNSLIIVAVSQNGAWQRYKLARQ